VRSGDLSAEARRTLLAVARRAIAARLAGEPPPREDVPEELRQPCGAFVTLRLRTDGELRGCVGYVEAGYPLVEAVGRAAATAATEDSRFDPVTPAELAALALDISVLSPLRAIAPGDVQVGTHGLVIRYAGSGGLLLPQVATEHGWDREAFLDATCRKAGLPAGTWRSPDVELLAFTAVVFGEAE
jgi:AmmeMemoRadiSam system protein A